MNDGGAGSMGVHAGRPPLRTLPPAACRLLPLVPATIARAASLHLCQPVSGIHSAKRPWQRGKAPCRLGSAARRLPCATAASRCRLDS